MRRPAAAHANARPIDTGRLCVGTRAILDAPTSALDSAIREPAVALPMLADDEGASKEFDPIHRSAKAVTAVETPDYHALDRLYALESEERQERRGLETRATTSIAAALTAVAFSANAVSRSSRLAVADAAAGVFLGLGAIVLFGGVFLCTFALLGGSATTIKIARRVSIVLAKTNIVLMPFGVAISLDSDLDRARVDVEDAAHLIGLREAGPDRSQSDDVERTRTALATAANLLQRLAGTSASVTHVSIGTDGDTENAQPPKLASPGASSGPLRLREPDDLETALRQAEFATRRLRDENAASVTVLRISSALIGLGVFVLVAGVVVLLAQHVPKAQ